jgi:hypothetical protein
MLREIPVTIESQFCEVHVSIVGNTIMASHKPVAPHAASAALSPQDMSCNCNTCRLDQSEATLDMEPQPHPVLRRCSTVALAGLRLRQ